MLTDLKYALDQLRGITSGAYSGYVMDRIQRAVDALERIEQTSIPDLVYELAKTACDELISRRPKKVFKEDRKEVDETTVKEVLCTCPADFCPLHGTLTPSEKKKGRKTKG